MSEESPAPMRVARRVLTPTRVIVIIILAFFAGYLLRGGGPSEPAAAPVVEAGHAEHGAAAHKEVWTCTMHPQVRRDGPGQCPYCGMDLVLVSDSSGGAGAATLTVSDTAAALMNIEVSPVERRFVTADIRLVGKVALDETTLGYISSWVPGRLDRLYVDYTGITVSKGDHLVSLYSPELLTAQEELRRAANALTAVSSSAPDTLRRASESNLKAARERLVRWGLTPEQVARAEKGGELSDHITIYAPSSGTVIEKNGREGMYVETGTPIYTIADLRKVWVKFEAYESDLPWLHYGQRVAFTTEAYPGETFEGLIAFIEPTANPMSRTVSVRVNVENAAGRLKPDMYISGTVHAEVATGGRVMSADLADKWISPMHPEIVKDGPGTCDICGMPLVRAADLGYASLATAEEAKPLVIPASAPLITGKRAVVYVKLPGEESPTFEGRVIELGPRAGDFYLVARGLEEGELVVTHGAFKIDSALEIQAKPSMMSAQGEMDEAPPAGDADAAGHAHAAAPPAFKEALRAYVGLYGNVHAHLAGDDLPGAREAAKLAGEAFAKLDGALLEEEARTHWDTHLAAALEAAAKATEAGETLAAVRTAFGQWSEALIPAVKRYGLGAGDPVFVQHCPMAFDGKGADWLDAQETIRNPYFGQAMLDCGSVEERIDGQ